MDQEMLYYADLGKSFDLSAVAAANGGASAADKGGVDPSAILAGGHGNGQQGRPVTRAKMFSQAMFESYPDSVQRDNVSKVMNSFLMDKMKLGTTGIGALLVTSINPQVAFIRNEETITENLLASIDGPELIMTDWVRRIIERRQGTLRATAVNPEQVNIFGNTVLSSVRVAKFNTLMFVGDPVSVTFMARAQAGQQMGIDLLKEETNSELLCILQARNNFFLNGVEQKSFAPQNVPQCRGIIDGIETNTSDLGGLDINRAVLELANADITAQIGLQVQKVMLANLRGMGAVRTIELGRSGGVNQVSYLEWERTMRSKFDKYKIPATTRVYEFDGGPPMPVFFEKDLPTGTAIIMTIDRDYCPRPVGFKIGGQIGPWMFVRALVDDLKETVFCMDGFSLDDPAEETRVLLENGVG